MGVLLTIFVKSSIHVFKSNKVEQTITKRGVNGPIYKLFIKYLKILTIIFFYRLFQNNIYNYHIYHQHAIFVNYY